jgi:hypothetical protein
MRVCAAKGRRHCHGPRCTGRVCAAPVLGMSVGTLALSPSRARATPGRTHQQVRWRWVFCARDGLSGGYSCGKMQTHCSLSTAAPPHPWMRILGYCLLPGVPWFHPWILLTSRSTLVRRCLLLGALGACFLVLSVLASWCSRYLLLGALGAPYAVAF